MNNLFETNIWVLRSGGFHSALVNNIIAVHSSIHPFIRIRVRAAISLAENRGGSSSGSVRQTKEFARLFFRTQLM